MDELKLCPLPWCMGKGQLKGSKPLAKNSDAAERFHVRCLQCEIATPDCVNEEVAINCWNVRVDLPEAKLIGMVRDGARYEYPKVGPEKCYGCNEVKTFKGEFCDDCEEAFKNEGREVLY